MLSSLFVGNQSLWLSWVALLMNLHPHERIDKHLFKLIWNYPDIATNKITLANIEPLDLELFNNLNGFFMFNCFCLHNTH